LSGPVIDESSGVGVISPFGVIAAAVGVGSRLVGADNAEVARGLPLGLIDWSVFSLKIGLNRPLVGIGARISFATDIQ
jgi:hypothetical protein